MNLSKYLPYPALHFALDNLRQCRITFAFNPCEGNALVLRYAKTLVRKARATYKAQIREDQIIARIAANRRKRYAAQHARKSRTLETASATRQARLERRQLARAAARAKRERNQLMSGYRQSDEISSITITT